MGHSFSQMAYHVGVSLVAQHLSILVRHFRAWDRKITQKFLAWLFPIAGYVIDTIERETAVVLPISILDKDIRDHLILYQWRWWWTNEIEIPEDIDGLIL